MDEVGPAVPEIIQHFHVFWFSNLICFIPQHILDIMRSLKQIMVFILGLDIQ